MVVFQGPLGKRDKHVEKTQGYEKSGQKIKLIPKTIGNRKGDCA